MTTVGNHLSVAQSFAVNKHKMADKCSIFMPPYLPY